MKQLDIREPEFLQKEEFSLLKKMLLVHLKNGIYNQIYWRKL